MPDFLPPSPWLALLATGGTIASASAPSGGAKIVAENAEFLAMSLAPRPRLPEGTVVREEDFSALDSSQMTPRLAQDLARRIVALEAEPGCLGVVVSHGTDTMEETPWLVELLARPRFPVVFTGARYTADAPNADGPRHLAQALTIASDSHARAAGVLISFEGTVHSARELVKLGLSPHPLFAAPNAAPLARFTGKDACYKDGKRLARPTWYATPERPHLKALEADATSPLDERVVAVRAAYGCDGWEVRAACVAGARALVVEGMGGGNVPAAMGEALLEAHAAGVLVVMASRCPVGVPTPTYGGAGGGHTLHAAGITFSRGLAASKLRLLLMVLLRHSDRDQAARLVELLG